MKSFPLVTILLLGCSGFALADWEFETVDGTVGTGQYSSLALDSDSYPHIVYQYFTPALTRQLFYAHWNGSNWEFDVIDGDGPDENAGAFCSIALDSDDTPHVSYYDLELKALKYAKLNSSNWDIEVVETSDYGPGFYSCIVVDSSGYPRIAYMDENTLDYAYKNASGWHIEVAASSTWNQYQWISMVLDSNDEPHISFLNWFDGDLLYTHKGTAGWSVETVDSYGYTGIYSSIAVTSNDLPLIAYCDGTGNNSLNLARWNGTSWELEVVRDDYNMYCSLELDSADNQCISFFRSTVGLMYGTCEGMSWNFEIVDNSTSMTGLWSSLELDDNGSPHISYQETYSTDILKYAFFDGSSSISSSTIPVGSVICMLSQAYSNPSDGDFQIEFTLQQPTEVSIRIFDLNGRVVTTAASGEFSAGTHITSVNGLASGVYLYELSTDSFQDTKKIVVR